MLEDIDIPNSKLMWLDGRAPVLGPCKPCGWGIVPRDEIAAEVVREQQDGGASGVRMRHTAEVQTVGAKHQ